MVRRGTNKRNAKLGQRGEEGIMWSTFEILGPLHISGKAKARNFKFGKEIDHQGY